MPVETRALYHEDAYLRTFDADVVAAAGPAVALSATAFYPGGGGQPHDLGRLVTPAGSVSVTRVWRDGGLIWHTVEGDPPAVGAALRGELDWDRRYALMRTHTALHILSAVVWRNYGARVTGGNMEPLHGRMDFEFETLRAELVREIEEQLNAEATAGRPVRARILPREEADRHPDLIRTKVNLLPAEITLVRIVEIEGLDVQADGGTHVVNTGEIGPIRVVDYKSKGRINKRLEIAVGA